jgi:hypothetical protein
MTNERHEKALEAAEPEWIEHNGSKFAPVADWISVDVITNRGRIMENEPAGIWDWSRDGADFIIAYRPHDPSKAPNHFTNGE